MTPSTDLRPATTRDADRLAELARASYSVYLPRLPQGVRPAPMDADYAASVARGEVWVAGRGQHVAGFVVLVPRPDHLLLENIAVHPDSQGQGIGRALLVFAEQLAAEHGLASVRLYTHAVMVENQRLYERAGYAVTARGAVDGYDRIFYAKEMRPGT